jgi:hypothetical protein
MPHAPSGSNRNTEEEEEEEESFVFWESKVLISDSRHTGHILYVAFLSLCRWKLITAPSFQIIYSSSFIIILPPASTFQGLGLPVCSLSELIRKLRIFHTVGRISRTTDQSVARPQLTQDNTNKEERRHPSMPRVGFKFMIPVFHMEKTFRALNRTATVIGVNLLLKFKTEVIKEHKTQLVTHPNKAYIYIYIQFFR